MLLKELSLILPILWIQGNSPSIIPETTKCSKIDAGRDFLPYIWLKSKNRDDEASINLDKRVTRIVNERRSFTLGCWAPFPVTLRSTSIVKNKVHVDQVKDNLENHPSIGSFMVTSSFNVEAKQELHLIAECMPACDPNWFLYGAKMSTKEKGSRMSEIVSDKVFSDDSNSLSFKRQRFETLAYLVSLYAWGFVIIIVIMTFKLSFIRQEGRHWEDIQLHNII